MNHPNKETKPFDFNNITVSFRFVLPLMFAGYFYAYNHDREIQQQQFADIKTTQTEHFAEIKESQAKIWNSLNSTNQRTDDRFAYVYTQCCSGARTAPTSIN